MKTSNKISYPPPEVCFSHSAITKGRTGTFGWGQLSEYKIRTFCANKITGGKQKNQSRENKGGDADGWDMLKIYVCEGSNTGESAKHRISSLQVANPQKLAGDRGNPISPTNPDRQQLPSKGENNCCGDE